jgi:hypothetical protein
MLKRSVLQLLFILVCSSSAVDYNHCSDLLLMPTAFTMEKNSIKISDYEVLILSGTFAFTSRTEVGTIIPFPILPSFLKGITLFAKQNYLRFNYFNSAIIGSYIPIVPLTIIGNVITVGNEEINGNILVCYWKNYSDNHSSLLSYNLGMKVKWFIFEYFNSRENTHDDFYLSNILLGARINYKRVIIDFAGLRPLASTDGLLLWPYLKVSFLLKK